MSFRTDDNNNPTAFTTDVAKQGGLVLSIEYDYGDSFTTESGQILYTAKLIGDPIALTIKVIDKLGFYTVMPHQRWTYIGIPYKLWMSLSLKQKQYTIGIMYENEGGTTMKSLFPEEPV
jgi:hypothetical protein